MSPDIYNYERESDRIDNYKKMQDRSNYDKIQLELDKQELAEIIRIKKEVQTNMANLKETAKAYQPKRTRNIAELEVVNLETIQIEDRNGTNDEGKEFAYKVAIIGTEEYRVPMSVFGNIKTILDAKPSLKTVRVIKKGQGMNTEYTVIPLD